VSTMRRARSGFYSRPVSERQAELPTAELPTAELPKAELAFHRSANYSKSPRIRVSCVPSPGVCSVAPHLSLRCFVNCENISHCQTQDTKLAHLLLEVTSERSIWNAGPQPGLVPT
jgi:hypothetical protein